MSGEPARFCAEIGGAASNRLQAAPGRIIGPEGEIIADRKAVNNAGTILYLGKKPG